MWGVKWDDGSCWQGESYRESARHRTPAARALGVNRVSDVNSTDRLEQILVFSSVPFWTGDANRLGRKNRVFSVVNDFFLLLFGSKSCSGRRCVYLRALPGSREHQVLYCISLQIRISLSCQLPLPQLQVWLKTAFYSFIYFFIMKWLLSWN